MRVEGVLKEHGVSGGHYKKGDILSVLDITPAELISVPTKTQQRKWVSRYYSPHLNEIIYSPQGSGSRSTLYRQTYEFETIASVIIASDNSGNNPSTKNDYNRQFVYDRVRDLYYVPFYTHQNNFTPRFIRTFSPTSPSHIQEFYNTTFFEVIRVTDSEILYISDYPHFSLNRLDLQSKVVTKLVDFHGAINVDAIKIKDAYVPDSSNWIVVSEEKSYNTFDHHFFYLDGEYSNNKMTRSGFRAMARMFAHPTSKTMVAIDYKNGQNGGHYYNLFSLDTYTSISSVKMTKYGGDYINPSPSEGFYNKNLKLVNFKLNLDAPRFYMFVAKLDNQGNIINWDTQYPANTPGDGENFNRMVGRTMFGTSFKGNQEYIVHHVTSGTDTVPDYLYRYTNYITLGGN